MPPMNVSVAELKADLSRILRHAAEGEEIVVTKHGKPLAKISGASEEKAPLPKIGAFESHPFSMADDFDELGPEWDEYIK